MAVVPARQMWVNANFKETQLTDVRIGQSVNIISDLYGENVVSWSGDRDQYGNRQCVLLITCTKCDRELDQNRSACTG